MAESGERADRKLAEDRRGVFEGASYGGHVSALGGNWRGGKRGRTHIGPQAHHVTAYALPEAFIFTLDPAQHETAAASAYGVVSRINRLYENARDMYLSHLDKDEGVLFERARTNTQVILSEVEGVHREYTQEYERLSIHIRNTKVLLKETEDALTSIEDRLKNTPLEKDRQPLIDSKKRLLFVQNNHQESVSHTQRLQTHLTDDFLVYCQDRFLAANNMQRYVSFPPLKEKGLNPSKGEGSDVAKAMRQLKAIEAAGRDAAPVETKRELSAKPEDSDAARRRKSSRVKKASGMAVPESIPFEAIVNNMAILFHYPKVGKKDIQRDKTKIPSGYNVGTITFRDNDLKKLRFVFTLHILMFKTCFPNLTGQEKDLRRIINEFIEKVLKEKWGIIDSDKIKRIQLEVIKNTYEIIVENALDRHEEEAYRTLLREMTRDPYRFDADSIPGVFSLPESSPSADRRVAMSDEDDEAVELDGPLLEEERPLPANRSSESLGAFGRMSARPGPAEASRANVPPTVAMEDDHTLAERPLPPVSRSSESLEASVSALQRRTGYIPVPPPLPRDVLLGEDSKALEAAREAKMREVQELAARFEANRLAEAARVQTVHDPRVPVLGSLPMTLSHGAAYPVSAPHTSLSTHRGSNAAANARSSFSDHDSAARDETHDRQEALIRQQEEITRRIAEVQAIRDRAEAEINRLRAEGEAIARAMKGHGPSPHGF